MIRAQYFNNLAADIAVTMEDISNICTGPRQLVFLFGLLWCNRF